MSDDRFLAELRQLQERLRALELDEIPRLRAGVGQYRQQASWFLQPPADFGNPGVVVAGCANPIDEALQCAGDPLVGTFTLSYNAGTNSWQACQVGTTTPTLASGCTAVSTALHYDLHYQVGIGGGWKWAVNWKGTSLLNPCPLASTCADALTNTAGLSSTPGTVICPPGFTLTLSGGSNHVYGAGTVTWTITGN